MNAIISGATGANAKLAELCIVIGVVEPAGGGGTGSPVGSVAGGAVPVLPGGVCTSGVTTGIVTILLV
jgi:anti-sigma-K factor RskA